MKWYGVMAPLPYQHNPSPILKQPSLLRRIPEGERRANRTPFFLKSSFRHGLYPWVRLSDWKDGWMKKLNPGQEDQSFVSLDFP